MEIVDYDKTKHWDILIIRDKPESPPQGFIFRFVGESGKETRICCTPDELQELKSGITQVLM
jgi:hypothetical protein